MQLKPRIFKSGSWYCTVKGAGPLGFGSGPTPADAYEDFKRHQKRSQNIYRTAAKLERISNHGNPFFPLMQWLKKLCN